MATEAANPKTTNGRWVMALVALAVGIGMGVAVDRFALSPAVDPELTIFEQTGPLSVVGERGEINFPHPYALAPNVVLEYTGGFVAVAETKATGFRWESRYSGSPATGTWSAKGIKATKVP